MTKSESRYERLDQIERLLARQPNGRTTGELARELGVHRDTILRDLALLEARGTGLTQHGRHYRLDHRRALHTVKLSSHEMLALYVAARLASRHSDEHNPHVVSALERLAGAVEVKAPLLARHVAQAAAAVTDRRPRPAYIAALETVTRGWIEGRKVRLRYRSYTKDELTERTFAPYFIEPSSVGYATYAIGYDDLRGALRTLKIERMDDTWLTAERFTVPAEFNPRQLLDSAWGVIWAVDEATEVSLRFAPAVARRVKESFWHQSQRIEDLPDGACRFTVRVGSLLELTPWVRQWGAAVEVLSPPEFRAQLAAEARAMMAVYDDLESTDNTSTLTET